jgi:cytochrome c biogenesis protein
MRTALVLLFLLALAAVPGSIVPQQNIDASRVSQWQLAHPQLTPIYEKLGLFSVYNSVWFSAVYILLMVSLVGCVVPRLRIYWRGMRARPPKAPRHFGRLPQARMFELDEEPSVVLTRARQAMRRNRYRADVSSTGDGSGTVSGERGYLREAGNLLFHTCVLVVLVGFAVGQLYGYKGGVITVVGQDFSNSLSQYDDFTPGSLFNPDSLPPMSLTVEDFHVKFLTSGPEVGQPSDFSADLSYRAAPGSPLRHYRLAVNHPLTLPGVNVFLVGHGYAPVVTVRDGAGHVAYHGPVIFLPQDSTFSSFGVIKVPDARPQQIGLQGIFLPTYFGNLTRSPVSQFPDALNPVLSLLAYHGDLGMNQGAPQSVYDLDKQGLRLDTNASGAPARVDLRLGQTRKLAGGGSISFDRVDRWVKLQVSNSPGKAITLAGLVLALLGLMGSLFIRPRRAWVRVTRRRGRTLVELAGLDRSSGGNLGEEIDELQRLLMHDAKETT